MFKLRHAVLALFLLTPLFGEDYQIGVVGPFGGLNNTDNSLVIPATQAQDLLNVDVSLGGKSVKKRKGYGEAFTLDDSTSGVHGIYNFYNSNGSDVSLFFNGSDLASSVSGGSLTLLFSTGPSDATYQCVDSDGYAYCTNTDRTSIIKTDGATQSPIITVNSTGTMLAITPERLAMAGFPDDPSRIDLSKANDFATWTIGAAATDAAQFNVVSPGSKITHIVYAHDRLYWFKESSFGFILIGNAPAQEDWQIVTLNNSVGTYYNTSIFRNDILYFQGSDGHYYAWDGANLIKLSRDIQESINVTQSQSLNSWVQTTESDWNAGVFDNTVFADTGTVSGDIRTLFPDDFNTFRDGSGSTLDLWDEFGSGGTVQDTGYLVTSVSGGSDLSGGIKSTRKITQGATIYANGFIASGGVNNIYLNLALSSSTAADSIYPGSGNSLYSRLYTQARKFGSGNWNITVSCYELDGSTKTLCNECVTATGISNWALSLYASSSDIIFGFGSSPENVSVVYSSFNHTCDIYDPYIYWGFGYIGAASVQGSHDRFTIVPQTFTFSSQVHNAADLVLWGSLDVTKSDGGGSHTFSMRSDTNSFTSGSSTPSWTTVTAGDQIGISTGSYVQFRDYFNYNSTNSVMSLSDVTINWNEGGASDKTYAIYHDDALWWSVTGPGSSTNNRIHKFDLVNPGWFVYDIPMNGMLVRNDSLYFGSPTVGEIYKFGTSESDDGSDIEAYWKSKDFFIDSPFIQKDFRTLSASAKSNSGSTLNVSYTLNGTTTTTINWDTSDASNSFTYLNRNLPLGKVGTTINFQFGNDAADQPFEVYMLQYGYTPKTWKPTQ